MNRIQIGLAVVIAVAALLVGPERSAGGVGSKALAAAEKWFVKGGVKTTREGVEALAAKAETLAARHGSEALTAVERLGPKAVRLAEEAGEHAGPAIKAIARHGEAGAVHVASRPSALALVAKHGDAATDVLVKHNGVVESVLTHGGDAAVTALANVGGRNGRRLAMLADSGDLARLGRTPEVLGVIAKYGDPAASFVWEHKGALTVGAASTAFLRNPEPFLDRTKDLAALAADAAVRPLAEAPGAVATEAARGTNWTVVALAGLLLGGGVVVWYVRAIRPDPHRPATEGTS